MKTVLDFSVNIIKDFGINMNPTIKQFAIETGICSEEALNDPEGHDGYAYYDKLSRFIELTKKYYVDREMAKTVNWDNDTHN